MPTLTVQANDTATAMEEIWDKLGPDAMIVSTKKRQGRVFMEATTEVINTSTTPPVTESFKEIFSGKMLDDPVAERAEAATAPSLPSMKGDLARVQKDIARLESLLSGLIITDLDGINPDLIGSTRIRLQQAGFSPAVLNDLKATFAGLSYEDGYNAFLARLATRLVDPNAESILTKRLIFVVGATGTGRTAMAAKLVAMLRDAHPMKEIVAASLNGKNAPTQSDLRGFGRLLNVPVCDLSIDTPESDFDKMTDYDVMVLDVTASPEEACQKIQNIKTRLGTQDIATILTMPGSTSRTMIDLTLQKFETLHPTVALTKLDECETTPAEFSALAEQQAQIGILSGTKSVIGAAMFASENILLQYLIENFTAGQGNDNIVLSAE